MCLQQIKNPSLRGKQPRRGQSSRKIIQENKCVQDRTSSQDDSGSAGEFLSRLKNEKQWLL